MTDQFDLGAQPNRIWLDWSPVSGWVVQAGSAGWDNAVKVLNRDGEWEVEPPNSKRNDDFIARTHFPLDEAVSRAQAQLDAATGAAS